MANIITRFRNAWNVFRSKELSDDYERSIWNTYPTIVSTSRPDIIRSPTRGSDRTILNAIYTRIAMDVAALTFQHVKLDENGRYLEPKEDSTLNNIFNVEANLDQTGRQLIQDICLTMFHEGCIAAVITHADEDPRVNESFDVYELRVGLIQEWRPASVRVKLYDERTGQKNDRWLPKSCVAIIENPLGPIMNEPNSTLQRLIRKLSILDKIDEISASGKLDLLIQLPYTIRSDARKRQAEDRKKMIEEQLSDSKYGIAYIDATEHVTQLNRSVENNLLTQIEYLTGMVYSQLGLTQAVMDGTASEQEMLNYYNRTVEPIASAIVNEFKRKFLTKNARTRGEDIMFFRDPFKLVPVEKVAEIADKFTRNEIMTSNEIRAIVGYRPSDDPNADELRNKNLNQSPDAMRTERKIGIEDEKLADRSENSK